MCNTRYLSNPIIPYNSPGKYISTSIIRFTLAFIIEVSMHATLMKFSAAFVTYSIYSYPFGSVGYSVNIPVIWHTRAEKEHT